MCQIMSSNKPKKLYKNMVDCCMHVGDVVDGILPIETGHGLIYFHCVVASCVANEMIEKISH